MKAIGGNPVDAYIRAGTYPLLPQLPYAPGNDVCGIVAVFGDEVTGWQVGGRVYSSGTRSGGYTDASLAHRQVMDLGIEEKSCYCPDRLDIIKEQCNNSAASHLPRSGYPVYPSIAKQPACERVEHCWVFTVPVL